MNFTRKISLLATLALLCHFNIFGKTRFEWTPALQDAYRKAISLRLDSTAADLATIRQKDPDNLLALHVENYVDFFRIYLNEDEAEFRKLEKNRDKRLAKIEDEGDPKSPYFLFLQADIRLQWALARLKFEEYSTAFFETNKAFKLLTKNAEKFPHFMPNKKDLGILHSITGTIPGSYKWAVDWLSSLEGTLEQGRAEMEEVVNYAKKNDFVYEDEVYVYYAYLLLHLGKEKEQEEAWEFLQTVELSPAKNPLACFVKANVALRTDRGDEAIKILENRPSSKQFHTFFYLDYMLGVAKLQRLDKDADVPLLRYVENFKGKNFIKDAYQKLAWHSLLQNDRKGYDKYMSLCKSKGYTIVGNDRSASEAAKSGEVPVLELLKARLLFDGGRPQRAYDLLKNKKPGDFFAKKNQMEFAYRMGRITHKLNRHSEALKFYQQTIDLGKDETWY